MKKISNLLQTSLVLHHKLGHVRNFSFSVSMFFWCFCWPWDCSPDNKRCQNCCHWAGKLGCLVPAASPGPGGPCVGPRGGGRHSGLQLTSRMLCSSPRHAWPHGRRLGANCSHLLCDSASSSTVKLKPKHLEIPKCTLCPEAASPRKGGWCSCWSCQNKRGIASMA